MRLFDREKIAGVCREFGNCCKTGYKIYVLHKDLGIDGLTDQIRRPYWHANQMLMQIERLIVTRKKEYPHWGRTREPRKVTAAVAGLAVPHHQHRACPV